MGKMNPIQTEVLTWLLENDPLNPGVRYWTLRDILGLPEDDLQVMEARREVMQLGPVPVILAAQQAEGYWAYPGSGYSPKYKSTVWQIIFLAEFGADPADLRVQKGCRYVLEHSLTRDGVFSASAGLKPSAVVYCLNGNLLYALQRLGFADEPRVVQALELVAGIAVSNEWHGASGPCYACTVNDQKVCAWGVIKFLKALHQVSQQKRTPTMQRAIEIGAALLLEGDPVKAGYPYNHAVSPNWFQFDFPLSYWSDVLENVDILVRLGYGVDKRIQDALQFILEKQDEHGQWKQRGLLQRRMWVDVEKRGKPGKWVTLRAARVFKNLSEMPYR
jgi:hypothetical protein